MNLVASKKRFMEWIDAQIKDEEVIVITNNVGGNLSASAKTNRKNVTLSFPADAFARPNDVGHIAFGKTPVVALCICAPEHISETALELIDKAKVSGEKPKEIVKISYQNAVEIMLNFQNTEKTRFLAESEGKFIAVDNSSGEGFTEEFKTAKEAVDWLNGEFEIEDREEK